ncbi:P-loop containing nucleoside triphosphate hydrolase protein, partial [Saccharata proteae CBS 121410]
ILIAISGPSSSGKTTLARLLRSLLPHSTILHLDDFYVPDIDIPTHGATRFPDWDCLDALNIPQLRDTLAYVRTHGVTPPGFESKEDKNETGKCAVDDGVVARCKAQIEAFFDKAEEQGKPLRKRIVLVEGFLLFSQDMAELGIRDQFDARLLLRADFATAKTRREERSGYVTLEGFWEDPPGYVEKIVWPNYVEDHGFLFEGGDVEGEWDEEACREAGVVGMPKEAERRMDRCLEWATTTLLDTLAKQTGVQM